MSRSILRLGRAALVVYAAAVVVFISTGYWYLIGTPLFAGTMVFVAMRPLRRRVADATRWSHVRHPDD